MSTTTVQLRWNRAAQHRALLRSLQLLNGTSELTMASLLALHEILLPPTHPDRGLFRDGPLVVRFNGIVQWIPPPVEETLRRTQETLDWVNACSREGLTPERAQDRAARVLFEITDLHPFRDGNGRVARALATWLMLGGGWALLMDPGLYCHARVGNYYRALDSHNVDPALWPRFFAELTDYCFVRKRSG